MAQRIPRKISDLVDDLPGFERFESLGIYVGAAEPPLKSFAEWSASGTGYWAWVDVSSAVGSTEVFSVGGAVLSGSSPVAASRPVLSSGGAVLSGSPLTSCSVLTAGSGGPVLSGSATVSMGSAGSVIVSSMGGIVSGGVSVPLRGVVVLPAGGAVLSGTALSAKGSATASAGGAVLSGTASVAGAAGAAQVSVASTGGAVLSGAAAQSSGRVSVASGGVVMSGSASVEGAAGASAPTPTPTISATGGNTTVSIALTNSVSGATSWSINWGTSSGSRTNTIDWATIQAATPTFPAAPFVHTGRTNGTTYYYSLVAVNTGGSAESVEVSAAAVAPTVMDTFDSASGWTFGGTAGNANIAGGRADMSSTSSLENTTMTKTFSGVSAGKLRFDLRYTMIGFPSFVVHVNGVPTGIYATPATWGVSPAIDCPGGNITVMFSLNDTEDTESVMEIDNLRWSAT